MCGALRPLHPALDTQEADHAPPMRSTRQGTRQPSRASAPPRARPPSTQCSQTSAVYVRHETSLDISYRQTNVAIPTTPAHIDRLTASVSSLKKLNYTKHPQINKSLMHSQHNIPGDPTPSTTSTPTTLPRPMPHRTTNSNKQPLSVFVLH